jgi:ssDNA thymidine ADP-ribosyltransferase DarT-like protein
LGVLEEPAIAVPDRILLYHFTHVRNLAGVVRDGLLCDAAVQSDTQLVVEAGHRGVKERRRERPVTNLIPGRPPTYQAVGPGGVVADYVPFYFAPKSPTLYKVANGGVPEYQEGQEPLVFLITDIATIQGFGLPFVFSDGNCANAVTAFFDDPTDLGEVDWELMRGKWWSNTLEDPDRMRRRAAEFLVHRRVPWQAFLGVATMTSATADKARAQLDKLGVSVPVLVRQECYY